MLIRIRIPTPSLMDGLPGGQAEVEIEVNSPAEVAFEMLRRGCDKDYRLAVLGHLGQVWADDFPHWYHEPDEAKMRADLEAVHPFYRGVGGGEN